jgi:hypothetical protein
MHLKVDEFEVENYSDNNYWKLNVDVDTMSDLLKELEL